MSETHMKARAVVVRAPWSKEDWAIISNLPWPWKTQSTIKRLYQEWGNKENPDSDAWELLGIFPNRTNLHLVFKAHGLPYRIWVSRGQWKGARCSTGVASYKNTEATATDHQLE